MENDFLNITRPLEEEISVFETIRSYGGHMLGLDEHLVRLRESANTLGIPVPHSREELKARISEELDRFGSYDAIIRPTIYKDKLHFFVSDVRWLDPAWYEGGMKMMTAPEPLPLPNAAPVGAKSTWYGPQALTLLMGHFQDSCEILFLDPHGFVGEPRITNIFIVKRGVLMTPPAVHILNGVTRRVMLDLARKIPVDVKETPLTRHDVYNADECFITNSIIEALPISKLDGRVIASGKAGPVARKLRALYQKAIYGT